ncbi:hypothetical protein SAMN02745127_02618 [Oceanospirillum multiglobuliferum]|uniref:Acetyl-CoA acetyltransferase n=1 Tax=Oceanospirillum multiglobuliferum TaxID=64969 RepID=A0A1T4RXT2_9GAMM|nr:hypothetical protein [Oceanospirillum multiglobuliferum]OPX54578.1 hypothetical protein BTE48_13425 [Oceanospirillum multiglobuliferum]SKA20401.1 hypothetical protein SAMN02745127_02618 [Oceanospirillum multiglobuliferum]
MTQNCIIAADRILDQQGDLSASEQILAQAAQLNLRIRTLEIDPLRTDWNSPVQDNHYRSGCAPIEALAVANRLLNESDADIVVIHGRDYLRSEYSKADRHQLMNVYGDAGSLPEGYTALAKQFCQLHNLSLDDFIELRDALFNNLSRTAAELDLPLPDQRWYSLLTELFRGVDCANPLVDFEGCLVLCTPATLPQLSPAIKPIRIQGIGIGLADADGPEQVKNLATYHALEKALHYAEVQSGIEMATAIAAPNVKLDAYTCYPVVPLALLVKSGAATDKAALLALLSTKPVTQTGGMNLGRGAWNNPALNGLISMCLSLQAGDNQLGIVHGNGGLGYKQGIAVLKS